MVVVVVVFMDFLLLIIQTGIQVLVVAVAVVMGEHRGGMGLAGMDSKATMVEMRDIRGRGIMFGLVVAAVRHRGVGMEMKILPLAEMAELVWQTTLPEQMFIMAAVVAVGHIG
jgi:hypothetical protein